MEGICAQEKRNDSNFPRKGEKKSNSKHHTLLTLYRGIYMYIITLNIIHRLAKGGFQMLDLSCWKENSRILSWKNSPFYIHHLRLGDSLHSLQSHAKTMHSVIHVCIGMTTTMYSRSTANVVIVVVTVLMLLQGSQKSSVSAVRTATPASLSGFIFSFDHTHGTCLFILPTHIILLFKFHPWYMYV